MAKKPATLPRPSPAKNEVVRVQRAPAWGETVEFYSSAYRHNEPEMPRLALIHRINANGTVNLTVFQDASIDEAAVIFRPNVVLMRGRESPGRLVQEWCRLVDDTESAQGNARPEETIPVADGPGDEDDDIGDPNEGDDDL